MEDYGAALLIQDTFAGARDSTVVIAPGGLKRASFQNGNALFSPIKKAAAGISASLPKGSTCQSLTSA